MEDSGGILALAATAAAFGAVHTTANPAHYLPFVAIGKSHGWGLPKILAFAVACGMGHLLSSVAVGGLGIAFGAGVGEASFLDAVREDIMKWAFLAFAAVYFFFGLRVSISGRGRMHCCESDVGAKKIGGLSDKASFWTLFLIFTLGPCEILAPLVMVPASDGNWEGVCAVVAAFSASTLAAMLACVSAVSLGLNFIKSDTFFLRRWGHAIAGAVILLCALALFFESH